MEHGLVRIDVSGLPIGPIFKGRLGRFVLETWLLKMETIGSPATSVLNQLTLRNNPEDKRTQFNRSGSLRSFPEKTRHIPGILK